MLSQEYQRLQLQLPDDHMPMWPFCNTNIAWHRSAARASLTCAFYPPFCVFWKEVAQTTFSLGGVNTESWGSTRDLAVAINQENQKWEKNVAGKANSLPKLLTTGYSADLCSALATTGSWSLLGPLPAAITYVGHGNGQAGKLEWKGSVEAVWTWGNSIQLENEKSSQALPISDKGGFPLKGPLKGPRTRCVTVAGFPIPATFQKSGVLGPSTGHSGCCLRAIAITLFH